MLPYLLWLLSDFVDSFCRRRSGSWCLRSDVVAFESGVCMFVLYSAFVIVAVVAADIGCSDMR